MRNRFFLVLIIFFTISCDLVNTREPEAPLKARTSNPVPVTPDILFENLKKSVSDIHYDNYVQCFADQTISNKKFLFIAATGASAVYNKLLQWSLEEEKSYFYNFSKSSEKKNISVYFTNVEKNNNTQDWTYKFNYKIVITDNQTKQINEYQGFSQLELIVDSRNQWIISEWRDYQMEKKKSWSDLKGEYN